MSLTADDLVNIKHTVLTLERQEIAKNVDPSRFFGHLRAKYVLDERDCDEIRSVPSRVGSAEVFVDTLKRKGGRGYDEFCNALMSDKTQMFLLQRLTQTLELLRAKVIERKTEKRIEQQRVMATVNQNALQYHHQHHQHHHPSTSPIMMLPAGTSGGQHSTVGNCSSSNNASFSTQNQILYPPGYSAAPPGSQPSSRHSSIQQSSSYPLNSSSAARIPSSISPVSTLTTGNHQTFHRPVLTNTAATATCSQQLQQLIPSTMGTTSSVNNAIKNSSTIQPPPHSTAAAVVSNTNGRNYQYDQHQDQYPTSMAHTQLPPNLHKPLRKIQSRQSTDRNSYHEDMAMTGADVVGGMYGGSGGLSTTAGDRPVAGNNSPSHYYYSGGGGGSGVQQVVVPSPELMSPHFSPPSGPGPQPSSTMNTVGNRAFQMSDIRLPTNQFTSSDQPTYHQHQQTMFNNHQPGQYHSSGSSSVVVAPQHHHQHHQSMTVAPPVQQQKQQFYNNTSEGTGTNTRTHYCSVSPFAPNMFPRGITNSIQDLPPAAASTPGTMPMVESLLLQPSSHHQIMRCADDYGLGMESHIESAAADQQPCGQIILARGTN